MYITAAKATARLYLEQQRMRLRCAYACTQSASLATKIYACAAIGRKRFVRNIFLPLTACPDRVAVSLNPLTPP